MKKITTLLVLLITITCYSQEYYTIDNAIFKGKNYQIQAKFNTSDFNIKIANKEKHEESLGITYDVDSLAFQAIIINLIKKLDDDLADNYNVTVPDLNTVKNVLPKVLKKKKALRSITEIIDGEPAQYSGALQLNPIVKISHDPKLTKTQQNQLKELEKQKKMFVKQLELLQIKQENSVPLNNVESSNLLTIYKNIETISDKEKAINDSVNTIIKYFHIHKAYINFFNNKASTIVIEGKVPDEKDIINDNFTEITSVNNFFSVPIRYFNSGESTNSFNLDGKDFYYNYNDVFAYNADEHYNYSIANTELHFDKDNLEQQVRQRQFFDFFTAILYTDVMAFDNNNSNSLVNAQAKLLLPLNQRNTVIKGANFIFFRQLIAEANLALYNGSNDTFRTIEITQSTTDTITTNTNFNHFELLTKNNINGNLSVDFLSHEAKRYFSHISLGYQGAFYRTALKVSSVNSGEGDAAKDDENISSLISTSHGPYLNIEIRPQTNFGADVSLSLNNLSYSGANSIGDINIKEAIVDNGVEHFGFQYNVVNIKADFYWLTNPKKGKKGGVFARLGAYYHTQNYQVHPQLMVGYATNLTSFVNKFSPNKEEDK